MWVGSHKDYSVYTCMHIAISGMCHGQVFFLLHHGNWRTHGAWVVQVQLDFRGLGLIQVVQQKWHKISVLTPESFVLQSLVSNGLQRPRGEAIPGVQKLWLSEGGRWAVAGQSWVNWFRHKIFDGWKLSWTEKLWYVRGSSSVWLVADVLVEHSWQVLTLAVHLFCRFCDVVACDVVGWVLWKKR